MANTSNGPKSVRAIERTFTLLEVINEHSSLSLAAAVAHTGYPKTTAYRALENLCRLGYLEKDKNTNAYRAALRVTRLSSRFLENDWIFRKANPLMAELGRELIYPLALATPFGTSMIIRDSTDFDSPVATTRYGQGTLLPLLKSASGKAWIAHCRDTVREELCRLCATSGLPEHELARHPRVLDEMIGRIREQGYARTTRSVLSPGLTEVTTLAVPVMAGGDLVACLSIRHLQEGAEPEAVIKRYLPPLQAGAGRIGEALAAR